MKTSTAVILGLLFPVVVFNFKASMSILAVVVVALLCFMAFDKLIDFVISPFVASIERKRFESDRQYEVLKEIANKL